MTKFKALTIGALLILVASCGGGKQSGPASLTIAPTERSQSVVTDNTIEQILEKSTLSCGEGQGNCPSGLGLLVGIEDGLSYRCSAFVLENGLIYTNSHCLPESIRGLTNVDCRSFLGLVFNVAGVNHKVRCNQIVNSTTIAGVGIQDVAVLKADLPSTVRPFKSSLRSRYSGERVSIFRVNPKGDWNGEANQINCSLKSKMFFGEFFDGPQSPALNTLGCETMGGNSGSPLIDKDGFVLGIHQSSLKEDSNLGERIAAHFKTRSFSTLGTATNLSCLCEKFGINQSCSSLPASCSEVEFAGSDRRRSSLVEQEMLKRNGNEALKLLNKMSAGLPSFIRWEVAYGHRTLRDEADSALRMNLMVSPQCIESRSIFKQVLQSRPSEIRETTHTIEVSAPHCRINFLFNGLFDFESISIDKASCTTAQMVLYLRQKDGQWEGEAQFVDDRISSDDRPYPYNFKLPVCK